MKQINKDEIKSRCCREIFSFDDIDEHKRDIYSYVRELGYNIDFNSNLDKTWIEWHGYKEIINKGTQINYSLARVIRELRKVSFDDFAQRTFEYKVKETRLTISDIRKQEWKYFYIIKKYEEKYGREKTLLYFGLNDVNDISEYSLAERCYIDKKEILQYPIVSSHKIQMSFIDGQTFGIWYKYPLLDVIQDLKTLSYSKFSKKYNVSVRRVSLLRNIVNSLHEKVESLFEN